MAWTLAIGVAAVVAAAFTGLRRYWAFTSLASGRGATSRQQLFAHLQRLHFAFHDRSRPAS